MTNKTTSSQRMAACEQITGNVDPWEFASKIGSSKDIGDYLDHFGAFLRCCGVKHFSSLEVCTPSNSSQNVASRTGATRSMYRGQFVLVLPVWLWTPMGAVVKLADEVRAALGAPITFRNGVRPWWINQQVASSGVASDHPMTAACDLDLSKSGDLKAAHEVANDIYHRHAEDLELSLGLGDTVVHFGIHSPNGHRRWSYQSPLFQGSLDVLTAASRSGQVAGSTLPQTVLRTFSCVGPTSQQAEGRRTAPILTACPSNGQIAKSYGACHLTVNVDQ